MRVCLRSILGIFNRSIQGGLAPEKRHLRVLPGHSVRCHTTVDQMVLDVVKTEQVCCRNIILKTAQGVGRGIRCYNETIKTAISHQ